MGNSFRSTGSFGKRQEYIAVAKLLQKGFDVYMTLVDDQQIDCVVRLPGEMPQYVDIQIKARSRDAKQASTFAALAINNPRKNFVFIFYSEAADTYWIMPSLDLIKEASKNKTGINAGKYSLVFANKLKNGDWKPRPRFDKYRDNWQLITDAAS